MKKIYAAVSLSLLLLTATVVPTAAFAQSPSVDSCDQLGSEGIKGIFECVLGYFEYIIYLIMALSVVYIVRGAFNMIASEDKREEGKQTIYYGVIALFVMMSIWGFVNILNSTFKLDKDAPSRNVKLIP